MNEKKLKQMKNNADCTHLWAKANENCYNNKGMTFNFETAET